MAQMSTIAPARKVVSASLGGAVATVAIYFFDTYAAAEPLPVVVSTALTTIIVFAVGYYVPPSPNDTIIMDQPA